jgi:hypothetical protein
VIVITEKGADILTNWLPMDISTIEKLMGEEGFCSVTRVTNDKTGTRLPRARFYSPVFTALYLGGLTLDSGSNNAAGLWESRNSSQHAKEGN